MTRVSEGFRKLDEKVGELDWWLTRPRNFVGTVAGAGLLVLGIAEASKALTMSRLNTCVSSISGIKDLGPYKPVSALGMHSYPEIHLTGGSYTKFPNCVVVQTYQGGFVGAGIRGTCLETNLDAFLKMKPLIPQVVACHREAAGLTAAQTGIEWERGQ